MGLGRDGTLHGTYESRLCLFPLSRPVSRKACKTKTEKKKLNTRVSGECSRVAKGRRPRGYQRSSGGQGGDTKLITC